MTSLLLAAILSSGLPGRVNAIEAASFYGSRRGAFLTRGVGGRAAGMGEAYTAVGDEASAVSWNPAGPGRLTGFSAVTMYDVAGQGMGLGYAAAALPVGPGVAGAAVSYFNFGEYESRDESGSASGNAVAADLAVSSCYAIPLPGWVGVHGWGGAGVELVSESVGGMLMAANLGVVAALSSGVTAGVSVLHLGPGKEGFSLPTTFKVGAAYAVPRWGTAAVDVGYEPGVKLNWIALGAELTPMPDLALRVGYKADAADQGWEGLDGLTIGLGGRLDRFGLDYAYRPFGDLAVSHRVALVYGLRTMPTRDRVPHPVTVQSQQIESNPGRTVEPETHAAEMKPEPASLPSVIVEPAAPVPVVGMDEDTAPVIPLKPDHGVAPSVPPAALFAAAKIKYGKKDYRGAWKDAADIIKQEPRDARAWQLLGNCQYKLGDTAGALKSFGYALQFNPDNPALKAWVDSLNAPK